MKNILFIVLFCTLFIVSCSKVRESAGVTRKVPDEFKVIENPPLIIPPDFELLPPGQNERKNIDDAEKKLAEEILFGLDEDNNLDENQLSTMNQILSEADVNDVTETIRSDIDSDFANEINSEEIVQIEWENEQEALDAVNESKKLRENQPADKIEANEENTQGKEKKKKKKKRKKKFFFF